jgi:hypothetical protein
MIERNFKPGVRMCLYRKDLDITVEAGKACVAALPVASKVRGLMTETPNDGQGDLDNTSFFVLLEELSNMQVKQSWFDSDSSQRFMHTFRFEQGLY